MEQKQREFISERKLLPIQYDFIREDQNECIELLSTDMNQILMPETASRLMKLPRLFFGNRTEIEAALVSNFDMKLHFYKKSHRV